VRSAYTVGAMHWTRTGEPGRADVRPQIMTRVGWATDAGQQWALYAALIVLNVADVITTAMVLDRGGTESNPFVQPIVHQLWLVGLIKAMVLALVGCLLTRCRDSRMADIALVATTGWYLAVVGWNITVLTLL